MEADPLRADRAESVPDEFALVNRAFRIGCFTAIALTLILGPKLWRLCRSTHPAAPPASIQVTFLPKAMSFRVMRSLETHPRETALQAWGDQPLVHRAYSDLDIWARDEDTVDDALPVALTGVLRSRALLGDGDRDAWHPTLVVIDTRPPCDPPAIESFARRHPTWVIPWPSEELLDLWLEEETSILLASEDLTSDERSALARDLAAGGTTHSVILEAMKSVVAQSAAHELGHLAVFAFIARIPPTGETGATDLPVDDYGSRLPDWMHETAAVLCEEGNLAEARASYLRSNWRTVLPLRDFLTMQNPAHGAAFTFGTQRSTPEESDEPAWIGRDFRLTWTRNGNAPRNDETASASDPAQRFYAQCWGFGRFLLETGGETLFQALLRDAADGKSFEDSLRSTGQAYGLPTTLDALERRWRAWLETRIGDEAK